MISVDINHSISECNYSCKLIEPGSMNHSNYYSLPVLVAVEVRVSEMNWNFFYDQDRLCI